MRFGMPTLLELNGVEDCAKLCAELGLDFIELNMNLPQYQLGNIDVSLLNSIAEKYGINYTIHLDENANFSDFNLYVANAYLQTVKDTIEISKRLNANIINMHLSKGVYFTLPDKKVYLFEKYLDAYLGSIATFRDICENAAGDCGLTICIENTNGYESFQLKAIEILLQSKTFALTFDIGHSYAARDCDEKFILSNANRLRHFHIHDATRCRDHLTLGEGEINIRKYLDLANRLGASAVVETKTVDSLRKSCAVVKEF
ncbi:MAG: sugar phosphate isomerase/epimerase [Clostridia bacterium]|nr:sugar phosphate isomerase/epimerase [Clostridia bacterium]MDE7329477.1 sugar phosphate isomerase/epimerase [Clostridia bacterium]